MLLGSVTRGFRLARCFRGRDARQEFWPYAAVVLSGCLIVGSALSFLIVVTQIVLGSDSAVFDALSMAMMVVTAAVAVVAAALLAAAVTRRLHDRGHHGGWASVPLAALLLGLALMTRMMSSTDTAPSPAVVAATFATVLVYFVTLAILVVQLALPSNSTNTWSRSRAGSPSDPP